MTTMTILQAQTTTMLREAAERVRPGDDLTEVVARATWAVLVEPGDGVAGALVQVLGAPAALEVAMGETSLMPAGIVTPRELTEARARWTPRARPQAVHEALTAAARVGARLLLPGDAAWPGGLEDLGVHAPIVLWSGGDATALIDRPTVSIVGARAATAYGEAAAAELAGDLAASGTVVISGGAYGIDGAAHRAALGAGGVTVAFLAGGVDRAYPTGHQQLFDRIRESGLILSEVPCGAAPTKWRFLARNRMIAAAGQATVVVEAGWRSGSLNTAGHAASLGRPLGAVPGPITSAASAGCHRLLREYDAVCVTSAQEIRELCGELPSSEPASTTLNHERTRLCDALSTRTTRSVDDLARLSGLAPDSVRSLLGVLMLEGEVTSDPEGWRRRHS